jgi:hypothetical protein
MRTQVKHIRNVSFLAVLVLCTAVSLSAQQRRSATAASDEDDYESVFSYGVTTNTNSGLIGGVVLRKSILIKNNRGVKPKYQYFALEAVNVRHPKERGQQAPNGSRFVYGKRNYLFAIRPQYGREINLFRRSSEEGVRINGILAGGPTLGLVKPYYIQYNYGRNQIRNEAYDPAKHVREDQIIGSGGFFEGFQQTTITPGFHLKAAANFELDAFRSNNVGIEVGFLMEAFSKKILILSDSRNDAVSESLNRNFFTSAYLTLLFGNKK